MFIEKINFSIAGINFSYQYYPHMNISENSAIFNFLLKSNGPIDVNNTIYVLPSSNIMNYVIKNGIFVHETPVWKNYLFDKKSYYLFSPNGETNIALLEIEDENVSKMKTYLYNLDFDNQPLPICVTGLILQLKLFNNNMGFLMHGATIKFRDKGLILTGNSGVGKSTLSKLFVSSINCEQITDDRFIILKHMDKYLSYGNPLDFKIERNKNTNTDINYMLFLSHGEKNSLKILDTHDALHKLITISLLPYWDREKMKTCIKELESMSKNIKCYDYSFVPNTSAVKYLLKEFQYA